jgi:hypothetical protein
MSFSSTSMPVDIVDMSDPWAGEGDEETDV